MLFFKRRVAIIGVFFVDRAVRGQASWILPRTAAHRRGSNAVRSSRRRFSSSSPTKQSPGPHHPATVVEALMVLASRHVTSQATYGAVQLGVFDLLTTDEFTSADDVRERLQTRKGVSVNGDVLRRCMRLLAVAGLLEESVEGTFRLTRTGALLRTEWKSMILHWTEPAMWKCWAALPEYMTEESSPTLPFERANGVSLEGYYSSHPNSLRHANSFVKSVAELEVGACVDGFDWNSLSGRSVVDLGGHRGAVAAAVKAGHPDVNCCCLDLPQVIDSLQDPPVGVEFVAGDLFDASTVPTDCDAIFMKHIVFCEFDDDRSMAILRVCHEVLPVDGCVIIAEAVLPDLGAAASTSSRLQLTVDVMMMMAGREAAKTRQEWAGIATEAGFDLDSVTETHVPTCCILVLRKKG